MAKILVVDDDPDGRELLIQLLSHFDHHVLEARDGKEGLAEAAAHHPDLFITDIIMPTMDGYEFVRRLREDPTLSATPVVFYSAAYRELEALALARACGVTSVLIKPIEPEAIVRIVSTILGSAATTRDFSSECVAREDLGLLTDALRKTVVERMGLNARLAGLIQVGMDLTLQHEPEQLLARFCKTARDLGATRHAVIAVVAEGSETYRHYVMDGLEDSQTCGMIIPPRPGGHLATLLPRDTAGPVRGRRVEAEWLGLPKGFPPVDYYLGVPVFVGERVYGWLCLLNKLGADQFDREDERLAVTLAAQLAVAYENTTLFKDLKDGTVRLEKEIKHHERSKAALVEGSTLDSLDVDVARALVKDAALQEILQECTAALVTHLHAVFARIWTFNKREKMLDLQASAGMYTHLDGPHGHVPLGKFKIGRIAEERLPHLTNSVIGDPLVPEQEWARREGLVAFAGYPLNQKVSVLVLEKLGYRADAVVNGAEAIQRLQALPYDLVLMDCFMPQMDGFETTRALRNSENPRLRDLPVIALTASVAPGSRERCLSAGMNECISKPIQLDVIKDVLERFLTEKGCVGIP